jgi:hypothetical protein
MLAVLGAAAEWGLPPWEVVPYDRPVTKRDKWLWLFRYIYVSSQYAKAAAIASGKSFVDDEE